MLSRDILFKELKSSLDKYAKTGEGIKNLIYWSIRYSVFFEDMEDLKTFITLVNRLMKKISYKEFVQLFPITKDYDGDKWGWKDYFYTMNYIKEHGEDNLIENPFEFLMEYENIYTNRFTVKWMGWVNNDHEEAFGISIVDTFFFTDDFAKDSKGNIISVNKKGEVCKVANPHKPVPHLTIVK